MRFWYLVCGLLCSLFAPTYIIAIENYWWRHSVIYEIFIQSFKDSNADGIGDLNGLTESLPYLVNLGINAIWLTPFFPSRFVDNGYQITNYIQVSPTYGTMDDFDKLIREMKKLDIKLILDLVINHSSEEHVWFQKSIKRQEPYTNYYIWKDPKGYNETGNPIEPNNWVSVLSGPAWMWNDERKQFYYHTFTGDMPDFNMTNPVVMKELLNVIKFWLNKGVDGFRLDAAKHFAEDSRLLDEPYISKEAELIKSKRSSDLIHIYTFDQPETFEIIAEIRDLLNQYSIADGHTRIVFVEAASDYRNLIKYYNVSDFPINFALIDLRASDFITPRQLRTVIMGTFDYLPNGAVTNWVTDSHDVLRFTSQFGAEVADTLIILAAILPGVLIVYYGQEIGMQNVMLRTDQCIRNICDQLPARAPMQWDNSSNSGFTTCKKAWLPVNPNYWRTNVANEINDTGSRYNIFKKLVKIRQNPILLEGQTNFYVLSEWVFALSRSLEHTKSYMVLIVNLGSEEESVNIEDIPNISSNHFTVLITSINSEHHIGEVVYKNSRLITRPKSSVLLISDR